MQKILNKANQRLNEKVNIEIMNNELDAHDWELNDLVWTLYWFVDFFNILFFEGEPTPVPALTFERTNVNNLGFYRIGRNDFAVRDQINLNRLYIHRPLHETLATLLHEMIHSWEFLYLPKNETTKNWFHKKGFREKLAKCGILTDERGCHMAVGDPFVFMLKRHGVTFENLPWQDEGEGLKGGMYIIPPKPKPKGRSKLKKWSCGCTNVRVAIEDFQAECLKCGEQFKPCD